MSTLHGSALTLRPTWARLVLAGAKQLELRSYSCCARGAVAILPSGSSCVTGVVRRLGCTQSVLGLQGEERIRTIFHGAPCAKPVLSSVCDFPMLDRLVCTAAAEPRIESCDFFTFGELQQKRHLHRVSEDEKKKTFSTEFKPSLFTHASCLLIFHLEPGPTNQEDLQKWFPKGAYGWSLRRAFVIQPPVEVPRRHGSASRLRTGKYSESMQTTSNKRSQAGLKQV